MATHLQYMKAFENGFMKLADLPKTEKPTLDGNLDELLSMLRVGRLQLDFYRSLQEEKEGIAHTYVLYEAGDDAEFDPERKIVRREVTGGMTVAVYAAFQLKGDENWSKFFRERVSSMLHLTYVFNSRNLLMNMAERAENFDPDLDVHNLSFVLRKCGMLIAQKKIGGYIAMYFNLKRFTTINQQIGRKRGTLVMKRFAKKIESELEPEEYLGRIGGDNFLLLVKKANGRKMVKMLEGTGIVFDDESGDRILVSASIGIYVIDENKLPKAPTEIMDRVAAASHIAKYSVDTDVVYFDELFMQKREREIEIEAALPGAFKNEEFLVYYQPKISLDGLTLSGAEALCRWRHEGNLVSPGEFIPILERGIEICKLDFYMLEHVCRDIARWLDEGRRAVRISVNFSRRHLTDMDFLPHILEVIDKYKVPHEYIEVELTETTTDVQFRDLKRVVRGLQKEGISTAVDDFGVGYSSLNLIRDIPWNVLKIDRSFLPMPNETRTDAKEMVFRYVVAMAQGLNLECIVEGVETKEQIELLRKNNCMMVQGFFFDRPLPLEDFEYKLDNYVYTLDNFD